jgi:hypothetical protein
MQPGDILLKRMIDWRSTIMNKKEQSFHEGVERIETTGRPIHAETPRKRTLEEWGLNKENVKTLLNLLVLLVLGVVLVLVMKMMVSMETTAIIIVLLPLLGFLFLGGAIAEFAFGGISAKFARAANADIPTIPDFKDMMPDAKEFDEVGEKGNAALEEMLRDHKLSETKPIVLSLKLGSGDYDREKLVAFIEQLSLHRSFKLVVFLNPHKQFIACMPYRALRQLLIDENEGKELIAAINVNNASKLHESQMFVIDALNERSTNGEALRQMTELNIDTLVVIDSDRCLKGVVERDEIVNRMMLALLGKPATKP